MAERFSDIEEVIGSSPIPPTKIKLSDFLPTRLDIVEIRKFAMFYKKNANYFIK